MLEIPHHPRASPATSLPPRSQSATLTDAFCFVPVSGPEAAKGRGPAKRVVRAHVTRVQHLKSSTLSSTQDLQTWTVKPYIHRDNGSTAVRRKGNKQAAATTAAQAQQEAAAKLKRRVTSSTEESSDSDPSASESPTTVMDVVPRLPTGGHRQDPFWNFPVEHQPELPRILAHYVENIAVDIPELDGPGGKGLLRRSLLPLMMSEAAAMYCVLLMGASHYAIVQPNDSARVDLLHLKSRALFEINRAIVDHKRATSDALLAAVMKMAAYEAIFGDTETFAAHMRGLRMMLKLRGGFSTLGLDGLLERMIIWVDLNSAYITGVERHLVDEALPTNVTFPAPDPYHFAGIS